VHFIRKLGNILSCYVVCSKKQARNMQRWRAVSSNDMMMSVYLSSIMRTVVALHSLIENKEARSLAEKAAAEAETKAEELAVKASEAKEGKENGSAGDVNGAQGGTGSDPMDTK
jgi:hypothetical protein